MAGTLRLRRWVEQRTVVPCRSRTGNGRAKVLCEGHRSGWGYVYRSGSAMRLKVHERSEQTYIREYRTGALRLVYYLTTEYECQTSTPQDGRSIHHLQMPSMTRWHAELLINRLAWLIIAISIALPSLSSRSSSLSSRARAIMFGSAPE